ncbi:4Fe-4S dicluster domain-containing protein [Maridesulfovibrio hydrothermalis]|uniref:4Fe-4S ferredoxin iron-sulfur binding domain protein n=1 Tax=Maridesulfovibrio hydrothermalis AM13 = DSM 14728 TaxID=1121451 RepID=L0RC07_9BACT|nr:4Fe-4S dicluster domain-containing protein [Maridesulfovibrio hydrothermalis]CCO24313.1 4Fe-4S ferredoxin iron-sulfur binding domain protein [Maridesulfovibrio hydrothermalis AM13 = DSM 14728]
MKRVYPDKEYCMGCRLCEFACLAAHSENKDLIKAYREERAEGLSARKRVFESEDNCVAISCRHCDDPGCVPVCISGALVKDDVSGITIYDADKCVGCWACIMACPYGAIQRNKLENKIIKCDLCEGREQGPACVEACPNCALKYEER